MASIEERVEELIKPTVIELGYKFYDVQYVKEGQQYFLRVFIEKEKGSIDLNDCEKVSNAINPLLDEITYIKNQYFLEISSTGVEKILRKDRHLKENIGTEIEVRLFKPIKIQDTSSPTKEFIGMLENFDENSVYVIVENSNICVERKDIAQIKTVFDWDSIE